MSAFLGPIHYWLYRKIELQEALVSEIVSLGEQKGLSGLKEVLEQKYGAFNNAPLETIIDEGNIHGWLQDKVSRAEYKLAESITQIIANDPACYAEIEKVFYEAGENKGRELLMQEDLSLPMIYKGISDSLLDGMPCDHAVMLVKQDQDEIVWETVNCVHTRYWEEVGGDIQNYYQLRGKWFEGLAEAIGIAFSQLDKRRYALKIKA